MVVRFDAVSAGSTGSGLNIDFDATLYAQRHKRAVSKEPIKTPEQILYDTLWKTFTDARLNDSRKNNFTVKVTDVKSILGKDIDPEIIKQDKELKPETRDRGEGRGSGAGFEHTMVPTCVGEPYVWLNDLVSYLNAHPDGYKLPTPSTKPGKDHVSSGTRSDTP